MSLEILSRKLPTAERLSRRQGSSSFTEDAGTQLLHSDDLRITLDAFSDRFHLHLRPNNDLIHPQARITYYKSAPDGSGSSVVDRVEPLLRESVLVYGGEVVHPDFTDYIISEQIAGGVDRGHAAPVPGERGWARIMVVDAGDPTTGRPPIFEGAFSVDGVIHHISTMDSYMKKKLPGDPLPIPGSELVVFRDSDIMSAEEEEFARTGILNQFSRRPMTCAHDRLGFNVDSKKNPVLRYGAGLDRIPAVSWYDPLGIISPDDHRTPSNLSVLKRQGDINGGNSQSSKLVYLTLDMRIY